MDKKKPARAKTTTASNDGSFATKNQTAADIQLPAHTTQTSEAGLKQDIDTLASELPGVFLDRADDAWYIAEAVIGSRWLADHDGAHGAALAARMGKADYTDRRAIIAEVIEKFSYELGGSNLHTMEKIRGHFAIPAEATVQPESTAVGKDGSFITATANDVLHTVEDVDILPVGSVVRSNQGWVASLSSKKQYPRISTIHSSDWEGAGDEGWGWGTPDLQLPVTVLWVPETDGGDHVGH
jgi:hypothetical protein